MEVSAMPIFLPTICPAPVLFALLFYFKRYEDWTCQKFSMTLLRTGWMNMNLELLLWFCLLKNTPINLLNNIWDKFNVWEILPIFCFCRMSAIRGSPKYFDNIFASELWANIPTANCEIMSSCQIWELSRLFSSRIEWSPKWQIFT